MSSRKSFHRLSNLFAKTDISPLEPIPEVTGEEDGASEQAIVPSNSVNMLQPQPHRPSRLHRLSSFLPTLSVITDSKRVQDTRKPVPTRAPAPVPAATPEPYSLPQPAAMAPIHFYPHETAADPPYSYPQPSASPSQLPVQSPPFVPAHEYGPQGYDYTGGVEHMNPLLERAAAEQEYLNTGYEQTASGYDYYDYDYSNAEYSAGYNAGYEYTASPEQYLPPGNEPSTRGYEYSNTPMTPPTSNHLQKSDSPSGLQPLPSSRNQSPSPNAPPTEEFVTTRRLSLIPDTPNNNRLSTFNAVTGPAISPPAGARPTSYHSEGEADDRKRRSWLPGRSRSRNRSQDNADRGTGAWVNAGDHRIDYNLSLLARGEKVPELWEETADTFVYLFPPGSGRGPSFKVPSMVLSSSVILMDYIQSSVSHGRARGRSFEGRGNLSVDDATRNLAMHIPGTPPYTPKTSIYDSDGSRDSITSLTDGTHEIHLRFPTGLTTDGTYLSEQDVQVLVDIRNLFAFLTGQPLIGTSANATTFRIFLAVASMLKKFQFTNMDGSTFGESATTSFDFYVDELKLADVRSSREKTIEAIILGEHMRSPRFYTEAFTHAVGKYSAMNKFTLFEEVSPSTRALLERGSRDLEIRQLNASDRLTDFDFPSLFAGIAASTTSDEAKNVRFKAWKANFLTMRKQVLGYYKELYGSWPPKASSKKNSFVLGGLNRLVLKALYIDMCNLYDLKVNRDSITTRSFDEAQEDDDAHEGIVDPGIAALRKLLGEFDRSSPPVRPPVPFDVPLVPSMATLEPGSIKKSARDQNRIATRKLKKYETQLLIAKGRNQIVESTVKTPFLEMYRAFENSESEGKNAQELVDQTYGHWIFMYAVIQSLPMLVVDIPDLRYTGGVEYFLCVAPGGNLPWEEVAPQSEMYRVAGGQQIVSLPRYVVEYGVEAVFRRSHCWKAADSWIGEPDMNPAISSALDPAVTEVFSPLAPPPGFAGGELGMRPHTPEYQAQGMNDGAGTPRGRSHLQASDRRGRSKKNQRQSIALGLERLPVPHGPDQWNSMGRPVSRSHSPVPNYGQGSRNSSAVRLDTPPENAGPTSGMTFDHILNNMSLEEKKTKKGRKK